MPSPLTSGQQNQESVRRLRNVSYTSGRYDVFDDLGTLPTALFVGTGGIVEMIAWDDYDDTSATPYATGVVQASLGAGWYPISPRYIIEANTTATGLVVGG